MRIVVDLDVCQRHALCCGAVPEVFELNEAGTLEYRADIDESLRDELEFAADSCPTQAITIVE